MSSPHSLRPCSSQIPIRPASPALRFGILLCAIYSQLLKSAIGMPFRSYRALFARIADSRVQTVSRDLLPAFQSRQLHQDHHTYHLAAQTLHQLNHGLRGTACGDEIIHDQYPLSRPDAVLVHLDGSLPVLQFIGDGNRLSGKLSSLANQHKRLFIIIGNGGSKYKSSGFRPCHHIIFQILYQLLHGIHRQLQSFRVLQNTGYVTENNSLFRKIRYTDYIFLQFLHLRLPLFYKYLSTSIFLRILYISSMCPEPADSPPVPDPPDCFFPSSLLFYLQST